MARNLYEMGDRRLDGAGAWLNEKNDARARVVPLGMVLAALVLAGLAALVLGGLLPGTGTTPTADTPTSISEHFGLCDEVKGRTCVLSAASYSYHDRVYHLSDIVAPDAARPRCPAESDAALKGRRALLSLLNGGSFDAQPDPARPASDARLLTRDGVSLGQLMILKGFARPASAGAVDWCAGGDGFR